MPAEIQVTVKSSKLQVHYTAVQNRFQHSDRESCADVGDKDVYFCRVFGGREPATEGLQPLSGAFHLNTLQAL